MRISPIVFIASSLLAFGVPRALPQEQTAAPAHVSIIEGTATIDRGGEVEAVALNMPVVEGDRIRTSAGRMEIVFPDGSAVELEPDSEIEYLGGARIRIYAGTVENRPALVLQSQSAQYLPADSQAYATDFDQNGTWQYDTTSGNVWYPTVSADWRPYYYGYWSSIPAYGWTWIGYNRWAWPTHHYGRWGYGHNRWFWIPGRVYSSAWVSWGTAPGYVSWCPLGWDSRPVLSVGYSHGWNAWTIVPRDHFGWRGYPAHRYAIEPSRIAASTPFVVQRTQPSLSVRGSAGYVPAHHPSQDFGRGTEREGSSRAIPRYSNSNLDNRGFSSSSPQLPGVERGGPRATGPQNRGPVQSYGASRTNPIRAPQPSRPSYDAPLQPRSSQPPGQTRQPPSSYASPRGTLRVEASGHAPAPSTSRPMERGPSMNTRSPRATSRDEGVSRGPAPSAPRSTGGGHMANAPHAERGPSGGSNAGSHVGGSHDGASHGSGSQGTAVRRPR
jgi:hypothetical protein